MLVTPQFGRPCRNPKPFLVRANLADLFQHLDRVSLLFEPREETADCGQACSYATHAPASVEGAAFWAAGIVCAQATMGGLTLEMTAALAVARDLGATGWAAAELLLAVRQGMAAGRAQAAQQPEGG